MWSPCAACLARGRCLAALGGGSAARVYAVLLGTPQVDSMQGMQVSAPATRVCWECHALLRRISKFQKQVLEANMLLRDTSQRSNYAEKTIRPLSTLSITKKSGYDYELTQDHNNDFFDADWDVPVSTLKLEQDEIKVENFPVSPQNEPPFIEKVFQKSQKRKKVIRKALIRHVKTKKNEENVSTWPGKKVLLKGGNKNVKIVSIAMSREEMLKCREEDSNSKQFVDAPYKCTGCVRVFSHENVLKRHNSTHHKEESGRHKCPICSMYFSQERHMRRHHRGHYSKYVCSQCGYTQRSLRRALQHYNTAHEPGKTYQCSECNMAFTSTAKLRNHRDSAHKDRNKCQHCQKVLSNSSSLKVHLLIHTGMATFECSICHKTCRGESGLYSHMRTVHKQDTGEDTYCVDCDIQFKNKYNYKAHLRTSPKHATPAQLKFQCKKCNVKCRHEKALKLHERHYHQEYVCQTCNKNYNSWHSLRMHTNYKHKGLRSTRSHVCETCGKAFTAKQTLKRHLLVHTGERPYECDVCDSKFSQKSTLKTHQKLVHFKSFL